jgi:peptidoglycan/LPS O-acetylase OafA/YrhL
VAGGPGVDTDRYTVDPATRLGFRPALDGIRAIAVLPVVLGHTVSRLGPGGFSGVRLFFVLSGFLITTLLVEEWSDTTTIRMGAFYIRRALRLLPALFFLLAVYLACVAVLDGFDAVSALRTNVVTVVFYVANWKFVFEGGGGALGHLWSLSVEEQFYLLWPLGLYLMLRFLKPRTMLVVTAVLAAASWLLSELLALSSRGGGAVDVDAVRTVAQRHGFYGTDAVAYAILAGCLFALLRSSGWLRRTDWYQRLLVPAGIAGLVLYAVQVLAEPLSGQRELMLLLLTFGFVGMILTAVDAPECTFSRLLTLPFMQVIGRVSYGLYLWHFVVLSLLRRHLPDIGVLARTALAAVITTVAVIVSYKVVEQPFLRLKRRFIVDPAAPGHPE